MRTRASVQTIARGGAIAFFVCLLAAPALAARADGKRFLAVRAPAPPTIDGRLDDEAWSLAAPDEGFVQQSPREGAEPTRRTSLRVAYDDRALYVAFRCTDEGARVVGRLTRRDREIEADSVEIILDTRGDGATAYGFKVNAAGVQVDTLYYGDTSATTDWDAVWESAVSRDEGGWTAELAIPLSALRFPAAEEQSWGLQVRRYVSQAQETDLWAPVPRSAPAFVSFFGRLGGLTGLAPRRTFELRPYVATRLVADSRSGGALLAVTGHEHRSDSSVDAGLDLKLGLTSALVLDASINPDFAQVEADPVLLNLSRFEILYPEKRPFFLESLDLFSTPIPMFYSRRVGRPTSGLVPGDPYVTAQGESFRLVEAPRALRIIGAAKLTGKVTPHLEVGALAALTDREEVTGESPTSGLRTFELAPRRLFGVARARASFGDASTAGVQATEAVRLGGPSWQAAADHDAATQGADLNWVLDPGHWRLVAQGVLSERSGGPRLVAADGSACAAAGPGCRVLARADGTPLEPGDVGWGTQVALFNTGEHHLARLLYHAYSPRLDLNDAGFLAQTDEHYVRAVAGYVERRPAGELLSFSLLQGGSLTWSFDGVLKDANAFLYAEVLTAGFISLQLELDHWPAAWDVYETFDGSRWETPARTSGDVVFATDARRALVLSGESRATFGADGSYDFYQKGTAALQLVPELELSFSPEVGVTSAVRFAACATAVGAPCAADSAARSYRFARLDSSFLGLTLRGSWTFSPALSLQAYGQLFVDAGVRSAYRGLVAAAPRATLRRRDLVPLAFTGDLDGDGTKDDDFQDVALNLSVVLRWEFHPGSTVLGVFTRSERGGPVPGAAPHLGLEGLSRGPTEDVLLLKLVYFVG